MAKKKDKAAPAASDSGDAPKKRSKLKLALFALAPLVLGGAGYAGWTMFMTAPAEATAHADGHDEAHQSGHDAGLAARMARETAAETSFIYSFALSELTRAMCGKVGNIGALETAANEEAGADGLLANLSWMAANRRMGTITDVSCEYIEAEIIAADNRAYAAAEAKMAEAAKAEKGGH
ncbi:MAG: hypothetical protein AB7I79_00265 [Rhizobiaceae bacterium]